MADSQSQQIETRWSREALDTAVGSGSLDRVLHWIGTAPSSEAEEGYADHISTTKACETLRERAGEPAVVHGICSVLANPIESRDDYFTACAGFDSIVSHLPLATLRLYRPGIETLAASTADGPPDVSLPSLRSRAEGAVKFIDFPELAWAPQHKHDFMGERSVSERVHTAQQMKPIAKDLLGWLADRNWPPFLSCEEQLARFPEVAVDPIKEIIAEHRDDPEWLLHLLEFVEERVPIGALWEKLKPELALLAGIEAEDEDSRDLAEAAQRLIGLLNEWEKKETGNE
ncbi:hypothetical protein V8C35DRAFT_169370 [Trichoderma chlorosporum]